MTAWRSSSHHLLVRYRAHDRVAVILAPPARGGVTRRAETGAPAPPATPGRGRRTRSSDRVPGSVGRPPPDSTRPAKPARTPHYPRTCNLRVCPPMIRTVVARASRRRMTQEACAVEGAGDEGGAAAEVAEGLVDDLGGVELAGGARPWPRRRGTWGAGGAGATGEHVHAVPPMPRYAPRLAWRRSRSARWNTPS
jgi:hypothetical protein